MGPKACAGAERASADEDVSGGPRDRTEATMATACSLLLQACYLPQTPGKLPSANLRVALWKPSMTSCDTPGPQGVAELPGEKMIDSQHALLPSSQKGPPPSPTGWKEQGRSKQQIFDFWDLQSEAFSHWSVKSMVPLSPEAEGGGTLSKEALPQGRLVFLHPPRPHQSSNYICWQKTQSPAQSK